MNGWMERGVRVIIKNWGSRLRDKEASGRQTSEEKGGMARVRGQYLTWGPI